MEDYWRNSLKLMGLQRRRRFPADKEQIFCQKDSDRLADCCKVFGAGKGIAGR
jgi:hypothetical protein